MAAPGAADDTAMALAAENQRLQQQLAEQAATIQAQAETIQQQEEHMNTVAYRYRHLFGVDGLYRRAFPEHCLTRWSNCHAQGLSGEGRSVG